MHVTMGPHMYLRVCVCMDVRVHVCVRQKFNFCVTKKFSFTSTSHLSYVNFRLESLENSFFASCSLLLPTDIQTVKIYTSFFSISDTTQQIFLLNMQVQVEKCSSAIKKWFN